MSVTVEKLSQYSPDLISPKTLRRKRDVLCSVHFEGDNGEYQMHSNMGNAVMRMGSDQLRAPVYEVIFPEAGKTYKIHVPYDKFGTGKKPEFKKAWFRIVDPGKNGVEDEYKIPVDFTWLTVGKKEGTVAVLIPEQPVAISLRNPF